MMNYFRFHPIGQGLFYTGSLYNGRFNFVYDCGTSTDQKYIRREIDAYLDLLNDQNDNKQPNINLVVISHLHYDHYSGLKYLLEKRRVNSIRLPYFPHDSNLLNLTLYYDMMVRSGIGYTECKEQAELITTLYGFNADYSKRYDFHLPENISIEPETTTFVNGIKYTTDTTGVTNNNIRDVDLFWRFIFINKLLEDALINASEKLKNWFEKTTGTKYNDTSFVNYIEKLSSSDKKFLTIKKIYYDVFGKNYDLNLTSTVMIHFPLFSARSQLSHFARNIMTSRNSLLRDISCYNCELLFTDHYKNTASLLSGDAMFDDEIADTIRNLLGSLDTVDDFLIIQVPHHGSKKNWKSLNERKIYANKYVIPFGLGNSFGHPNKDVLDEMFIKRYDYAPVTQLTSYDYAIEPTM